MERQDDGKGRRKIWEMHDGNIEKGCEREEVNLIRFPSFPSFFTSFFLFLPFLYRSITFPLTSLYFPFPFSYIHYLFTSSTLFTSQSLSFPSVPFSLLSITVLSPLLSFPPLSYLFSPHSSSTILT